MASSKDLSKKIDSLLRERLENFEVSKKIRDSLRDDILAALEAPASNRYGAAVMTQEASLAADTERKHGANPNNAKPRII